ncbi:CPBP family intramembrane glutamic endopeptidase [Microbulbifer taiwanensis]|uniref:CPBP family intramembrane glutamic endopeptidase n=1 Tax=Microbulbifer taiwanensis TaxID=986746 RepID=A0ABW1YRS5_9GAMM|nr:CPBP family intramembrane glutamic endopeptidase [Microbulbifer taiwanensis]
MSQPTVETPNTFGLVMLLQLATLAIALAGIYFLDVRVSVLGASGFSALLIGTLGALLSYATAIWLTRSKTAVGQTLRKHCRDLHPLFSRYTVLQIALVSLAAGVCEELLFRGFLQPWLSQVSTPLLGLLGASVAFALLHYASFTYFVATLAVGLILGATYQLTESLLCVVTWHAVYDLLAITALARYPHLLGVPSAK